jgi:hypothetical protein
MLSTEDADQIIADLASFVLFPLLFLSTITNHTFSPNVNVNVNVNEYEMQMVYRFT